MDTTIRGIGRRSASARRAPLAARLVAILCAGLVLFGSALPAWATPGGDFAAGNVDDDGLGAVTGPGSSPARVSNTGSPVATVPIAVPPGAHGMQPTIAMTYGGDGRDMGLGHGWSFSVGYALSIDRSTRYGAPAYTDDDVFEWGEELLPNGTNRYTTERHGFANIDRIHTGEAPGHWVVNLRNGTRLYYGCDTDPTAVGACKTTGQNLTRTTPLTIISANATAWQSEITIGSAVHTYRWHLSRVEDSFGNAMHFTWRGRIQPGQVTSRYLTQIDYTLGTGLTYRQRVTFDWSGPNGDGRLRTVNLGSELDLNDGFRLRSIQTFTDVDGVQAQPANRAVRTYYLCYSGELRTSAGVCRDPIGNESPTVASPITGTRMLVSVADRAPVRTTTQPPAQIPSRIAELKWEFRYLYQERNQPYGWSTTALALRVPFPFASRVSTPGVAPYDTGARLVDLDLDGRVDMVRSINTFSMEDGRSGFDCSGETTIYLNRGNRFEVDGRTQTHCSRPFSLWPPGREPTYFRTGNNGPKSASDARDRGVQVMDVNGDGLQDVVFSLDMGVGIDPSASCPTGFGGICEEFQEVWLNNGNGWTAPPSNCNSRSNGAQILLSAWIHAAALK